MKTVLVFSLSGQKITDLTCNLKKKQEKGKKSNNIVILINQRADLLTKRTTKQRNRLLHEIHFTEDF